MKDLITSWILITLIFLGLGLFILIETGNSTPLTGIVIGCSVGWVILIILFRDDEDG